MPKISCQLVNPIIHGSLSDVYDADQPLNAAKNMWEQLSKHVVGHVPNFVFTMRNISNNKYHHFRVREDIDTKTYNIKSIDIKASGKMFEDFAKKVDLYNSDVKKQQGGKKKIYKIKDDSSSSSSSSSSEPPRIYSSVYYPIVSPLSPISLFHYNTVVYNDYLESTLNPQLYNVITPIFTPIFRPSLRTVVSLWS